jgi:hypothetical protein
MSLKLPQIGGMGGRLPREASDPTDPWSPASIKRDFARRDVELKRADDENYKRNRDIDVPPDHRLILHSPNGSSWPIIVNDAGQITAKGGPLWLAETAYVERTSDYTVNTTSDAIISAPAQDVPAGYTIETFIEVYVPTVEVGINAVFLAMLRTNGTDGGIIARIDPKGAELQMPIHAVRRVTLPTGTYTFELAVQKTGSNAVTVRAGAGGAGNFFPAFLRTLATIHP